MILQFNKIKNAYFQVPFANLVDSKGNAVRSFDTSKQLIDWVILQFKSTNPPYIDYMIVANGPVGPQVAGPIANYALLGNPGQPYVPGSDADLLCDQHILYDSEFGLRQSTESGGGAGGWG